MGGKPISMKMIKTCADWCGGCIFAAMVTSVVEHAHSKKQWSEMLKESEDRGQHVFLFLYIHRSTECLIQKVHLLLAAQIYEQKSVQRSCPPLSTRALTPNL